MPMSKHTHTATIHFLGALNDLVIALRKDLETDTATPRPAATPTVMEATPAVVPTTKKGVQKARPTGEYDLTKYDLTTFSPTFKIGVRLSDEGVEALCHAIMLGKTNNEIAQVFQIHDNAPSAYRKRLKGDQAWNYEHVPTWL